jgi:hypothetical protein
MSPIRGRGRSASSTRPPIAPPSLVRSLTLPAGAKASQPYGVATDGSSVLIVSDANNARALVYSLSASAPYATLQNTIALPASAVPDGVAYASVATPAITGTPNVSLAFIGDESDNSVTIIDPPPPSGAPNRLGGAFVADGGVGVHGAPITLGTLARDPRGTALSPARAAALGDALAPPPAAPDVRQAKTARDGPTG